jgi:hypothetical protein
VLLVRMSAKSRWKVKRDHLRACYPSKIICEFK